MRGIHRIFGVTRYLLAKWLLSKFEKLPALAKTLVKWEPGDVLELDELWSFVLKKSQKRRVWIALCRRTRQVVAFAIGDRSKDTCLKLWNLTLRQSLTRFVRKSLSFSKSDLYHQAVLSLFIHRYNLILKHAIS